MLGKAWKRIGLFRSLKYHHNHPCLDQMHMSFIRPLLEYGDIIWNNCTNQQKYDIESVQNEDERIVTGATKYCKVNSMLAELNSDSLTDGRRKDKHTALYKMNHSLSPKYLHSTHTPTNTVQHRNCKQYSTYNCKITNVPKLISSSN